MREYIFYFLALVSIISALMVVFSRNPIHSVLYLVVCFFSIAGHYLLLNAQFLAVVHIIIYAGAIMVLFLFTIMLLNLNKESEPHKPRIIKFASVISGCLLTLVLIAAMINIAPATTSHPSVHTIGMVKDLGNTLFTEYLLPFEISSVLFLSAMVGVVLISKKRIMIALQAIDIISNPVNKYVYLAIILFAIGVMGVLMRRNAIIILMCIELMLNAANLLLVAFSSYMGDAEGQMIVFFVIVVAAAEVAVGLALLISIYRNISSTDINLLNRMKG